MDPLCPKKRNRGLRKNLKGNLMAFREKFVLSSPFSPLLCNCSFSSILEFLITFLDFQVYALTGGIAPLMPSLDINQLKRKALSESEKVNLLNSVFPLLCVFLGIEF